MYNELQLVLRGYLDHSVETYGFDYRYQDPDPEYKSDFRTALGTLF